NHIEEPTQIISTLANYPNFNLKNVLSWNPDFRSSLSLLLYFAIPGIYAPEIFQRVAMAKNIQQVKGSMTYAAGFFLLINLFMIWIAILLLTDNPHLKAN